MVGGVLLSVVTGCAVPRAGTAPPPPRPPVATRESLRINVVYPAATDILQSHDSAFVFGSVRGGSGPLRLTLEGRPVPVRGNGAWLAWRRDFTRHRGTRLGLTRPALRRRVASCYQRGRGSC